MSKPPQTPEELIECFASGRGKDLSDFDVAILVLRRPDGTLSIFGGYPSAEDGETEVDAAEVLELGARALHEMEVTQ